ncbi:MULTISPECIES: hypothetical protein [Actinomadura]|uniref:Uncharacterized protein n=1 Tax=Actinomadura litoris TaxID=2678616 RepID=A0A7K1L8N7_9ACTN|nr:MULTISPECIES: hypothetical protein [Actinomadura]MBT2212978.1 hypothetical protein [Actinomadura sp. NEAU-AAG7]MUN40789.1 hypothetical protein [Actinomadura litoris]
MWIFNSVCTVAVEVAGFYLAADLIGDDKYAIAALLILTLVVFFVFIAGMLYFAYRRSFWLDGRCLWRRGIVRDREYDLSVARIGLEFSGVGLAGPVVPRLKITAGGEGRSVNLLLCNRDFRYKVLPGEQLLALAAAIGTGRGAETPEASVAARLRQMAEDSGVGGVV